MGTLLAFTSVAVSVLVIRYVPPNELHVLASSGESSSAIRGRGHDVQGVNDEFVKGPFALSGDDCQDLILNRDPYPGATVDQEAFLGNVDYTVINILAQLANQYSCSIFCF